MGEARNRHQPAIVGDYALFGEIASGGMATVHFGRLLGPEGAQKTVAIKRLHAQYAQNPDFVDMFLDEGRVASRIEHPNVVPVLDVAVTGDELFLVMEYVHGESLAKLLSIAKARGEAVPLNVAIAIAVGLLHGLHAAHEAVDENGEALNIVHRDVSPPNIMVGIDGIARVLDFGVAKAAGRLHLTRDRELKGKLTYMAPEQVRGQAMDRRTDVYAASIVIWELLVGRPRFDGPNEAVVLTKVLGAEAEAPSELGAPVSKEIDAVVLKGLAREPSARFSSAEEMARALRGVAEIASETDVGKWVLHLAKAHMDARAEKLREVEEAAATMRLPEGWPTETRMPSAALAGEDPPSKAPDRPTPPPTPPASAATIPSTVQDTPASRAPAPWWVAPTVLATVGVLGMAAVIAWPAPPNVSPMSPSPPVMNDLPIPIELPAVPLNAGSTSQGNGGLIENVAGGDDPSAVPTASSAPPPANPSASASSTPPATSAVPKIR